MSLLCYRLFYLASKVTPHRVNRASHASVRSEQRDRLSPLPLLSRSSQAPWHHYSSSLLCDFVPLTPGNGAQDNEEAKRLGLWTTVLSFTLNIEHGPC
jgi:hypothetical protein